jgi:hypothetical protein
VSPRSRDPWRLPSTERFGAQLRDLENASRSRSRLPRSGLSPRAILLSSGGIAAAVICILLVLTSGRSAQARSVVNEAPAAAERSGSVRFQSVLTIMVDGHRRAGITEQGAIDFANGTYTSTVRLGNTEQVYERRSVNGVLYAGQRRLGPGARAPVHWAATHLQKGARGAFASEGDAFTDPPSVFRSLAGIRAPVVRVGHNDLDGVPTTRYHLLTNLAAVLRPLAGSSQHPLVYRRIQAALDVWLDAQGRPRQVVESFTGPSPSGRATMSTVVRFMDYERPVSVQAPPSSLVKFTNGSGAVNPLAAGPAAVLLRLLFFQPPTTP